MAKKVLNLFKRMGKSYLDNYVKIYGPILEAGCNQFVL